MKSPKNGTKTPAHQETSTATARTNGHERRRGFRRLGLNQRFLPILIVVSLISSFAIASLAYIAIRTAAINSAQDRARQDVRVAQAFLEGQGDSLAISNGQMVVISQGKSTLTLNGDTTLVDRMAGLLADATIYQLEGENLVAISSSVHTSNGARLLGYALGGPPYTALRQGNAYTGVVSLQGTQYVASFEPLHDANGAVIGAVSTATPLDTVLAPTTQIGIILLFASLLLALVLSLVGFWVFDSLSKRVLASLDTQLNAIADGAVRLGGEAHANARRLRRQERLTRQIGEQVYQLDTLARAMEHGHAALQNSAGEIWAEMSQPGLAPDPQRALQWAKQSVIISARVGTQAEQARDLCYQLTNLLNHVVAEGNAMTSSCRDIDAEATDLHTAVNGIEAALGERFVPRDALAGAPESRYDAGETPAAMYPPRASQPQPSPQMEPRGIPATPSQPGGPRQAVPRNAGQMPQQPSQPPQRGPVSPYFFQPPQSPQSPQQAGWSGAAQSAQPAQPRTPPQEQRPQPSGQYPSANQYPSGQYPAVGGQYAPERYPAQQYHPSGQYPAVGGQSQQRTAAPGGAGGPPAHAQPPQPPPYQPQQPQPQPQPQRQTGVPEAANRDYTSDELQWRAAGGWPPDDAGQSTQQYTPTLRDTPAPTPAAPEQAQAPQPPYLPAYPPQQPYAPEQAYQPEQQQPPSWQAQMPAPSVPPAMPPFNDLGLPNLPSASGKDWRGTGAPGAAGEPEDFSDER